MPATSNNPALNAQMRLRASRETMYRRNWGYFLEDVSEHVLTQLHEPDSPVYPIRHVQMHPSTDAHLNNEVIVPGWDVVTYPGALVISHPIHRSGTASNTPSNTPPAVPNAYVFGGYRDMLAEVIATANVHLDPDNYVPEETCTDWLSHLIAAPVGTTANHRVYCHDLFLDYVHAYLDALLAKEDLTNFNLNNEIARAIQSAADPTLADLHGVEQRSQYHGLIENIRTSAYELACNEDAARDWLTTHDDIIKVDSETLDFTVIEQQALHTCFALAHTVGCLVSA